MDDINEAIEQSLTMYNKTPFMMAFPRIPNTTRIADKLQIPIGTVKNRIHIARKFWKRIHGLQAI